MSSRVSESEQGELQGAIGAAQGLTMMAGPLAMTGVFEYFAATSNKVNSELEGFPYGILHILQHLFLQKPVPYVPGAPFLLAGALALLGLIVYLCITTRADRQARYSPQAVAEASDTLHEPIIENI